MGHAGDVPPARPGSPGHVPAGSPRSRHRDGRTPLIGPRLRRLLAVIVVGAALLVIGLRLRAQWQSLATHHWTLDWGWLALSLPAVALWFLGRVRLWQLAVCYQGESIAFQPALRIWTLSELGRYLPGMAWHVVGRSYLAGQAGVRGAAALLATLIELALITLVACLMFLVAVLSHWSGPAGFVWLTLGLVPLVLIALHPAVLFTLLNLALRRLGRRELVQQLRYGEILKLLGLAVGCWVGLGAGFLIFTRGFWPLAAGQALPAVGFYAGAWVIGLIVIVSPSGLGVREGALTGFLTPLAGEAGALALALGSRLWVTLAEVIFAGIVIAATTASVAPRGRSET